MLRPLEKSESNPVTRIVQASAGSRTKHALRARSNTCDNIQSTRFCARVYTKYIRNVMRGCTTEVVRDYALKNVCVIIIRWPDVAMVVKTKIVKRKPK